jgi:hypothetical protein
MPSIQPFQTRRSILASIALAVLSHGLSHAAPIAVTSYTK